MKLSTAAAYLRGERPGMGASFLLDRPLSRELAAQALFAPTQIVIDTSVVLTDVSFWQEDIDFAKMRALASGSIIRAGQKSWVDICFKKNWAAARLAGMPRGTYWFYDSREDPIRQAQLWHSLVKDDRAELVYVADFEESYGGPFGSKASMRAFCVEFIRLMGIPDDRFVIYTGYYWWMQRVGNDAFFVRFALWLAWYAAMELVRVPAPWTEAQLIFWQFTSSGPGFDYGVSSREIDLNYYRSDLTSFIDRFEVIDVEPVPGGSMSNWYRVTADSLYMRAQGVPGSTPVGGLVKNDLVEILTKSGAWGKIARILKGGTVLQALPTSSTGEVWCATAYLSQLSTDPVIPGGGTPDPGTPSSIVRSVVYYKEGDVEKSTELVPK